MGKYTHPHMYTHMNTATDVHNTHSHIYTYPHTCNTHPLTVMHSHTHTHLSAHMHRHTHPSEGQQRSEAAELEVPFEEENVILKAP